MSSIFGDIDLFRGIWFKKGMGISREIDVDNDRTVADLEPPEMARDFIVRLDSPETGSTCLTTQIVLQGWFLANSSESSDLLAAENSLQVLIEEHRGRETFLYGNMGFSGHKLVEGRIDEITLESFKVFPARSDQFGPLPAELGAPWCIEAKLSFDRLRFSDEQTARTFVVMLRLELRSRVSESNPVCFSLVRPEDRAKPRGGIDYPASGSVCSDFLIVEGWAMKPGDIVRSVEILAGATSLGFADCNLDSKAQAASLPFLRETANCRFSLALSRRSYPQNASFPLRAIVSFESGETLELSGPQFLWQPAPVASGAVILGRTETVRAIDEGLVEVEGWVETGQFLRPRLFLEGRTWRTELTDVVWKMRNDIEARYPTVSKNEPLGFSVRFHPNILGPFPGVVRLSAETSAGRVVLSSRNAAEEISAIMAELQSVPASAAKSILSRALCRLGVRKSFELSESEAPFVRDIPKRIAFVSPNLSRMEGAPRVLFEIIRGLIDSGVPADSILVLCAYEGELAADLRALGVTIRGCPDLRAHDQTWERYHRELRVAAEILSDFDADFIFANVVDSFWAIDAAQRLGLPAFWLLHESVDPLRWFQQLDPRLRLLFLHSLTVCPRVGFVAKRTQELFSPLVEESRSVIIPNGVDEPAIAAAKRAWPRERARASLGVGEELVISIIGTTAHRKGQDIFLREMALLQKLSPALKLRCFIVGARKTPFLQELRELTSRLNLEDIVTFVPETPEVAPYYRASDILVIASREESAPLVSLEAFAHETPLISTAVFGLAEQLDHEKNSLVFHAEHEGELAAAIVRLAGDVELRERLVNGGGETLRTKFSLERAQARYREEIVATFRRFGSRSTS